MLIGGPADRPSLDAVRRIKHALRHAIDLPEDAIITVTQLACLEEDCALKSQSLPPAVRRAPASAQDPKPTDTVDANDLLQVCESWGFSVQFSILESLLKEM